MIIKLSQPFILFFRGKSQPFIQETPNVRRVAVAYCQPCRVSYVLVLLPIISLVSPVEICGVLGIFLLFCCAFAHAVELKIPFLSGIVDFWKSHSLDFFFAPDA